MARRCEGRAELPGTHISSGLSKQGPVDGRWNAYGLVTLVVLYVYLEWWSDAMPKELEHVWVRLQHGERPDLLLTCVPWLPFDGNARTTRDGAKVNAAKATSSNGVAIFVEGRNVQRRGEEGAVRRWDAVTRWSMEQGHVRVREARVQCPAAMTLRLWWWLLSDVGGGTGPCRESRDPRRPYRY